MNYQNIYNYKIFIIATVIISIGYSQFDEQVEAVLKVNPEVIAAEYEYQSAIQKIKTKGVLPDPKLEAMFSIDAIETRNGPVDNQLMIGQRIPAFGKLKNMRKLEKLKAENSKQKLEQTKVDIAFEVRKNLSEYFKYKSLLNILNNFQEELSTFRKIAENQYANGVGPNQNSILKLQIEESLVETRKNKIQSKLEKTLNNLKVLFNEDISNSLKYDIEYIGFEKKSPEFYINLAYSTNPKYALAENNVTIAQINYKLSKLGYAPDLTLGLTYSQIGSTDLGGAVDAGKDAFGTKLGLNIPLWFGKNKARVKSASYILNRQKELLLNTKNRIESNINTALIESSEIGETYKIYADKVINESERMISSVYSGYENGFLSFLDLLDSIRLNVNIKLEFEDIKSRSVIAQSKLSRSVGTIYSFKE